MLVCSLLSITHVDGGPLFVRFRLPWADARRERFDPPSRGPEDRVATPHRRVQERPASARRAGIEHERQQETGRRVPSAATFSAPRRRAATPHREQDAADHLGQAGAAAAATPHRHIGHQGAERQGGAVLRVANQKVDASNLTQQRLTLFFGSDFLFLHAFFRA